jgi:hypothetical protein
MRAIFQLCFLSLVLASAVSALHGDEKLKLPLDLTVAAGQRERIDALVQLVLPSKDEGAEPVRLVETTGGKQVPTAIQLDGNESRLWWVASGMTAAGSIRTYRLETGASNAPAAIAIVESAAALEAMYDGKPLLRYNKAHVEPSVGVNRNFGRSAHLHPVWTPGGSIVTDELPPDHLHQSGIFLAFTKTEFEGHNVDFWNLGGGQGRVRFKELKSSAGGPVFGRFRAEHEHVDLTATDNKVPTAGKPAGGKVALVETWDAKVWNVGLKSGYWLLDISSQISVAIESPLHLPEYHYGGMAIRAARAWTPQHMALLTSEGDDRLKGNHTRPRWCDIHGMVDERMAGITLMTHPSNFRFPEPLRIHPTMPYMVYTPSFLGQWDIRPGAPHRARYRFVIHDGQLPAETLDRLWKDFAEPLTAAVQQP